MKKFNIIQKWNEFKSNCMEYRKLRRACRLAGDKCIELKLAITSFYDCGEKKKNLRCIRNEFMDMPYISHLKDTGVRDLVPLTVVSYCPDYRVKKEEDYGVCNNTECPWHKQNSEYNDACREYERMEELRRRFWERGGRTK